jgi:hypothetical protein
VCVCVCILEKKVCFRGESVCLIYRVYTVSVRGRGRGGERAMECVCVCVLEIDVFGREKEECVSVCASLCIIEKKTCALEKKRVCI